MKSATMHPNEDLAYHQAMTRRTVTGLLLSAIGLVGQLIASQYGYWHAWWGWPLIVIVLLFVTTNSLDMIRHREVCWVRHPTPWR